ncbi:MAG: transglutaminase family protein [Burkholderiaceae bacterium]|nr:transglutaminase family protein [Burkholderiaceae bacterium]
MSHANIEIEHLTHYAYAAPVDLAQHLAYLRPRDDAAQQVESFELRIEPAPMQRRDETDRLGNPRCAFTVSAPHRTLSVRAASRVQVFAQDGFDAATSLPWQAVRERLRYAAGAAFEPASEFLYASPFIPALPALRELALPSFTPGRPAALAAIDLMARLHAAFSYRSASTDVDTPLAEVLATREGVCQDFAHAMIGALRSMGLAAHYISGYLLTAPSRGANSAPLLGADASHAWLAVWCPMADASPARWLELDPTNNLLPGTGHVRLAIGRDYGDVTPLRGVIRGGGEHRLEVRVRTRTFA